MRLRHLVRASASVIITALGVGSAFAQTEPSDRSMRTSDEIVVTAQKREESINDVGMSIQAATGDQLTQLGITDTAQLEKIVPGFSATQSYYGTPVYTIRGIGFLDTSLAGAPTVSVYVDEVPLPYSIMTSGASLDLERVEVLKGPQGTLFGSNATGGAINYIAAKPTDTFDAGFDASYGRFETFDLTGYLSGPIAPTLRGRIAARILNSGDWQESYTRNDEWGSSDLIVARASLVWEPTDTFAANLTLSGFRDQGDTQMPQLFGIAVLSPTSGLDPNIRNYPRAPQNARAADWSACVNQSPANPPFGNTLFLPGDPRPASSTDCHPATKDNDLITAALRVDWDIGSDLRLTSLSAYEEFTRDQFIEGDGTIWQDYESHQIGSIETLYQELRLAGDWWDRGSWVLGANYQEDTTEDRFLQTYGGSTANPTALPTGFIPLGPTAPTNNQTTTIKAIFFSGDYPIAEDLIFQAGVRYTDTEKEFLGCGYDSGDGTWAEVSQGIQNLLAWINRGASLTDTVYFNGTRTGGGPGINVGAGNCGTTGVAPTFNPDPAGYRRELNEDNVSWRVGLNYFLTADSLIYGNVSKGFKIGAFPTVASSASSQLEPAVQEELLAYEVGFKSSLFDDTLQLNGAVFYYDYTDKQLLGAIVDPVFGPLPALVNVPEAHVQGFELSAVWRPIENLRISPVLSQSRSEVDGCSSGPNCINGNYFQFDAFSNFVNLTGQPFPASPEWQAALDVQYDWTLSDNLRAFVGGTASFRDVTNNFFYKPDADISAGDQPRDVLKLPATTLLDLRAGVENDQWRVQVWGRNVTDEYYWVSAVHVNDVIYRYAGMPATYGVTVSYRLN
ncbi:MAG: TonB-dependent receptor plug domain-containing protein [Alphaproteobacteria bacterium]|nr:TonB-dependent receptor plug domain-containing protein [Alphaproteobacteria bacterium]